jgi:hypothetical protein
MDTTSHAHHFHLELRHATVPTYVTSYLFPILLLAYEVYRVSYWVVHYGFNFTNFRSGGYEFLLMLAFVGLQIFVEIVFLASAAVTRHPDLKHRVANILAGIACSFVVIGLDLALQYAP